MSVVTTRMPTTACPSCGHEVSAATSPWGKRPKVGDLSVCANCLVLNRFADDLTLLQISEQEWLELDSQTRKEVSHLRSVLSTKVRVRA